jgi:serine/threonine-protein kinase
MHDHVAADSKFRERFKREIDSMARFQHPYAVTLYDASISDPQGPCIVMEYVRGVALDELLHKNGRLSPPRVGRLLGQLCEVLQAAHSAGIVHRDLKPNNLMVVDADTPFEKIKVMDFGLAKLIDPPRLSLDRLTDTNIEFVVGTPGYICPEQVRGEQMDHRGDLYSVGVILYELLTGRLPFDQRSTMDILLAHATELPPTFIERGATDWAPPAIEDVVRSCLSKDPAERPQSARDLAERYETALAHEQALMQEALLPDDPRNRSQLVAEAEGETSEFEKVNDPFAIVHYLEAWMPEKIAKHKLRGFVNEVGGEVIESVPGLIRVRMGQRSWLGFGRRSGEIDLELRLKQGGPHKGAVLNITVCMRPLKIHSFTDPDWRARCDQAYCDLRAYLMGNP